MDPSPAALGDGHPGEWTGLTGVLPYTSVVLTPSHGCLEAMSEAAGDGPGATGRLALSSTHLQTKDKGRRSRGEREGQGVLYRLVFLTLKSTVLWGRGYEKGVQPAHFNHGE